MSGVAAAWGVGAASVALVLAVTVKHDRDEAQRYERLIKRLAVIEEGARGGGEVTSALPPPVMQRSACTLDSSQLEAIARVVHEATSASAPRGAAPEKAEVRREVPRTPEQEDALARAKTLADGMLKRRRFTRDDAIELRRELNATGSPEDVQEIRRRIGVAINRDELVPDDPHVIP